MPTRIYGQTFNSPSRKMSVAIKSEKAVSSPSGRYSGASVASV